MTLSQGGLQDVLASSTAEAFLQILVIDHSDLSDPLRLVSDRQDLTRNDGTYHRFPFTVQGPDQDQENPPEIRVQSDAVDQRIVEAVRQLQGKREKATLTYSIVRASTPDTEEFGPVVFQYAGASTDGATQVTIEATFLKGALNDAFPAKQFAPSNRG